MKKVAIVNLAALFLLAGFFCAGNVPVAKALDSANASANVVIGQPDFTSNSGNQGGTDSGANKTYWPNGAWMDGKKLIFADIRNNRVLIYNSIPVSNNASADVVIGQADFTSRSANQGNASPGANTLSGPYSVSSDGTRLFVADAMNNRVLIYNTIPTSNNASADVVIGQADFTGNNENQGGSIAANTLYTPSGVFTYGGKMYVNDAFNNRVLIFNSIPTANNASANVAVGQADLTSVSNSSIDPKTAQNTLYVPYHAFTDGTRLFVSDYGNSRVLIYDSIPTVSGASANTVIGQPDFTSNSENQGGSAAANTLFQQGSLFYGAGKLFVSDVTNNRVLVYNLDAASTLQNKRSVSFSSTDKVKRKKSKFSFSGRKTGLGNKGRIHIYQDGVLKASRKVKKNGKWKAKVTERQTGVNRLYQFRYYTLPVSFLVFQINTTSISAHWGRAPEPQSTLCRFRRVARAKTMI
jgi:sugar lactone lactonase YvrE